MRGAASLLHGVSNLTAISTHAPHARRGLMDSFFIGVRSVISTHAPHARRGETSFEVMTGSAEISTHAPHARRGDRQDQLRKAAEKISTHAPHARRGAIFFQPVPILADFYSRASCEARQKQPLSHSPRHTISTHAPHARRGFQRLSIMYKGRRFLLTRLMRGAAITTQQFTVNPRISTHAPHARRGADRKGYLFRQWRFLLTRLMRGAAIRRWCRSYDLDFYSRASCEARLNQILCFLLNM